MNIRAKIGCALAASLACLGGAFAGAGEWDPRMTEQHAVGNNSVVTWNAGDFPKTKQNLVRAEWPKCLCVEPANLEERGSVTVAPGANHVLQLMIVSK